MRTNGLSLLSLKTFALLALPLACAQANPLGENVVAGNATVTRGAGSLTVNQTSDRVVINWSDFSIGLGEVTRFVQPSATAAALNRVNTGNPSQIFGSLQANGQVYLINPAGILIGQSGQINTRSFVASTHNVANESFLAGAGLKFEGNSPAAVRNEGRISALGGDVFLIANTVENAGTISAPQGTAGLAAGSEVILAAAGQERLSVLAGIGSAAKGVDNAGTVEAVQAELKAAGGNIYALAINNGGVVRATSVVREGGKVFLRSTGGNINNSGVIAARSGGGGGEIVMDSGHNGAGEATTINSGMLDARGEAGQGGRVAVLGDRVGLIDGARVDVSGQTGGGTILIGGDFQGKNPEIQNAKRTFVGYDVQLMADALERGDGGRVIVWADEVTRYFGSLAARGAGVGGDGGFAEVSGKEHLQFEGRADLSAPFGRFGSLLLDPKNITISSVGTTTASINDVNHFDNPGAGTSHTISPATLAALAADVKLQANNDITFAESLTLANHNLTAQAGRSILVNANITTAGGTVTLIANELANDPANAANNDGVIESQRDAGAAEITMAAGTTITTGGGDVIMEIRSGFDRGGTLDDSGNITIANIAAGAGDVFVNNEGPNGGSVIRAADPSLIAANSATFRTTGGASGIGNSGAGALNIAVANLEATTGSGGAFFVSPTLGVNLGGATPSGAAGGTSPTLNGINVAGGNFSLTAAGNINSSEQVVVGGSSVFTVTAPASDVLLGNAANNFGGTVTTAATLPGTLNNVTVRDSSALAITALNIAGALNLRGDGGIVANNDLIIGGPAAFTAGSGSSIVLNGTGNQFNNTVSFTASAGQLNNVTIVDTTSLDLQGLDITGSLIATASAISQSGALVVDGNATFTAANGQSILLNNAANNFGGSITLASSSGRLDDITLVNLTAIALGALDISGDLTVTSGANITAPNALLVDGNASFTLPGGSSITLGNAGNRFGGSLSFAASGGGQLNNVTVVDTTAIDLQGLDITGNLDITSGANITAPNALQVDGNTFFRLPGGSSLTVNNAGNDFGGAVNFIATGAGQLQDIAITDSSALQLGSIDITGMLSVNAGGDITQSGDVRVGGAADFTVSTTAAGQNRSIVLDRAGNRFDSAVTFNLSGPGTLQNVTVADSGALELQAGLSLSGNLNVSAAGNITDAGSVTVGGDATFSATAPGADITLDGLNVAGRIGVSASNGVGDNGDVTFVNATDVDFSTSTVGGALDARALAGNIVDSGNLTVGGAAIFRVGGNNSVFLNNDNQFNGTVAFVATSGQIDDLTIRDTTPLDLTGVDITGDLTVTATAISQSGALIVDGLSSFTANNNQSILLNNAANNFGGAVSFAASSGNLLDVSVTDVSALDLQALDINGALTVVAGGDITQSGDLIVDGAASFTGPDVGRVILGRAGNRFGNTLAFSASSGLLRDVTIADATDLDLPLLDITGELIASSGGNLTDAGTVRVGGNASFTTMTGGRDINLNGLEVSGSVALNTVGPNGDAAIVNNGGLNFAAGNVQGSLNAEALTGDIVQSGSLTVAGPAAFTAADGRSINLSHANNIFNNDVSFLASIGTLNNVTVVDTTAFDIQSGLSINGVLNVRSGGLLRDLGALTVGGDAIFRTDAGDIQIDGLTLNNPVSVVRLNSAANATIVEASELRLGDSTVAGSLNATATAGNVIGVGAIAVNNTASFTASAGQSVILDHPNNQFGGNVTFTGNGGPLLNVTVVDGSAFAIQNGLNIAGTLNVTAGGLLEDLGSVTLGGNAIFRTTAGDIQVDNLTLSDPLAEVRLNSAGNATISEANDLRLGLSSVAGDLNALAQAGDIGQTGVLSVNGQSTFTADSGQSITLDQNNSFADTVTFTSADGMPLANIRLLNNQSVDVGGLNASGVVDIEATGDITQSGAFITGNASTAFFTAHNGSILLGNGANSFGGPVAFGGTLNDVTIRDLTGFDIQTVTLAGLLDVGAAAVTQSGLITAGSAAIASGSSVTLGDISLNTASGVLDVDATTTYAHSGLITAGSANITAGQSVTLGAMSLNTSGGVLCIEAGNAPGGTVNGAQIIKTDVLGIRAFGPVNLANDGNRVNTLAAQITGMGQSFTYRQDGGTVTIANSPVCDNIEGLTVNNAPVNVNAGTVNNQNAIFGANPLTINDENLGSRLGELAALSYIQIAPPQQARSRLTAGVSTVGTPAQLPPNSIWMSSLHVPFEPDRTGAGDYRIEDATAWTGQAPVPEPTAIGTSGK